MSDTIAYYDKNAERFFNETVNVNMTSLYKPFLDLVPTGGRILDAGCGSGRDSLYFKEHGYRVEAFDASAGMCRLAAALISQPVKQMTFDEIEWNSEFDGVWAGASLLHVKRASMDCVLGKLARVLKPAGAFLMSVKHRDEEWLQEGRFFNGYGEESFRHLIQGQNLLRLDSVWTTHDARSGREGEQWLNAILSRTPNLAR